MSAVPPPELTPTVLIVDDTPVNLHVMMEFLETQGLRVLTAHDGEEALRQAETMRPDMILLDVMMPKMDGFEVCRRLKAMASVRETPVIFMTALADSQDKIRGFDSGGVDFVTKPVEMHELRARVTTHLRVHAMQKQLAARNAQLEEEIVRRTEATEALEEQRAFLQDVIDMIPQCLFVKERDDRFTMVNRALAELTHTTVEGLVGRRSADVRADPASAERVRRDDLEVLETRLDKFIPEETYTDSSGEVHILSTVLRPLVGKDGHAAQLLGVVTNITERKRIERELERYREGLEKLVAARTTELDERNRQLRAEVSERQRLQLAVLSATDHEQRRLAHELHDGLGQDLVGLSMFLHGAMNEVKAGRLPTAAEMERMLLVVRNALKSCRDIAHGLSPLTNTPGGLLEALNALKSRIGGPPGPSLELDIDADCTIGLASESCDHLYRIAQEAATNAIKHACAKRVTIRLRGHQKVLRLEILDDGYGMKGESAQPEGLGFHTMHDRAASIGGTLQMLANPDGGTTVVCQLPHPPGNTQARALIL